MYVEGGGGQWAGEVKRFWGREIKGIEVGEGEWGTLVLGGPICIGVNSW